MDRQESIFKDLIGKYFSATAKFQYNKINGSKEEPKYLHDQMLDEEYSADMTYSSISGNFSRITADIVSLDSPLPLKLRDSISSAKGDIPKIGLKYVLNEKQMNTLLILYRTGPSRTKELIKKIFDDSQSCVFGIKESIEQIHLKGFSSGLTEIPDSKNVGTSIRIDYNIPASNQMGVVHKWHSKEANPINDIKRTLKAAKTKGEYPNTIWMNGETAEHLMTNSQIKEQFAFSMNFTAASVPDLDEDQLKSVFKRRLKLNLQVIDRTFVHQKDGKSIVSEGWTKNMVVLSTGTKVGSLVYGTTVESEFKQNGVNYAEPNSYILLSKSGTTDPVSEMTAGQAMVIPVLQNVESLFYINTIDAQKLDDSDNEKIASGSSTDSKITIWSQELEKALVIGEFNKIEGVKKTNISIADEKLIERINQLSNEEEADLKTALGI